MDCDICKEKIGILCDDCPDTCFDLTEAGNILIEKFQTMNDEELEKTLIDLGIETWPERKENG